MFRVELAVVPRPGVKDPQAEAVQETLGKLGYTGVAVTGVGRLLALSIDCTSEDDARSIATELCDRLLVNPSLETFSLLVSPLESGGSAA